MADELLRCRQGWLFDNTMDPNLDELLYHRGDLHRRGLRGG
ncbi:MAG: hypothetical protein Q8Q88_06240 [Phenylobacterium sp.]|nr:hypothetical protein [Phenylobacterium sp.]MDP3746633.1 hypothetical protein [Phenylobacterium sp.]